MGLETKETRKIINVLGSEGDFRLTVPEGTEGAVRREYESSDGKTGVKHELIYKSIGGKIVDVSFYEGDYGRNLQVTFDLKVTLAVTCKLLLILKKGMNQLLFHSEQTHLTVRT